MGRDLGLGDPNAGEGGYYYSSAVEMLSIRAMSYVLCAGRRGLESSAVFRFFVVFDYCSRVCLFSEVQLEYIRELIRSTFLCGEGVRDFFVFVLWWLRYDVTGAGIFFEKYFSKIFLEAVSGGGVFVHPATIQSIRKTTGVIFLWCHKSIALVFSENWRWAG